MVCPNCQSNDIVELQNEHFCINCGRLIELVTKKRGVGRPKADRMDKPKALTIKLAGKAIAESIDSPPTDKLPAEVVTDVPAIEAGSEIEVAPEEAIETSKEVAIPIISRKFVLATASEAEDKSVTPQLPEDIAKIAEVKVRKRLQDILPAPTEDSKTVADDTQLDRPIKQTKGRLNLAEIISSAWSEPWQGGPARVLVTSAILAATATITSLLLSTYHVANLSNHIVDAGYISIGLAIALLFGVANTERAAFALRRYDHRPIPRSWLFGGALAVLTRQTTVLVAGLIDAGLLITLGLYAGYQLPKILEQPYSAVALLAIYFILATALLLIWVKTGLAAAGVELGRMSALEGVKFGWRSLWRHPELVGTRLVAALWLAASLTGVIALAYLIHLYFPSVDRWNLIGSAGIVAFTAILLGNFGAVGWRQASYRELVIIDDPEHAIAMLSGHHNGAPGRAAHFSYIFTVTLLILGGIGAILSSIWH
jgi:hypothetical protein